MPDPSFQSLVYRPKSSAQVSLAPTAPLTNAVATSSVSLPYPTANLIKNISESPPQGSANRRKPLAEVIAATKTATVSIAAFTAVKRRAAMMSGAEIADHEAPKDSTDSTAVSTSTTIRLSSHRGDPAGNPPRLPEQDNNRIVPTFKVDTNFSSTTVDSQSFVFSATTQEDGGRSEPPPKKHKRPGLATRGSGRLENRLSRLEVVSDKVARTHASGVAVLSQPSLLSQLLGEVEKGKTIARGTIESCKPVLRYLPGRKYEGGMGGIFLV